MEGPLLLINYGFVSTYPPTLCGLATFTAALYAELVPAGRTSPVLRLVDTPAVPSRPEVVGQLVASQPGGIGAAAGLLDECDTVIVQHEYGVYGGADGEDVLALLAALRAPSVVVLHTVLSKPTANQRRVLEAVASLADAVVTMTGTAWERLATGYSVDMSKVTVIPHGAAAVRRAQIPRSRTGGPTILTWGLIGRGKGVEWAIEAMAGLTDLDPAPHYLVAGQTHPKVLMHEGEAYRERLQQRIEELGLTRSVTLDGRYRSMAELAELVDSADVVLLPYDSTDQVTSGVLIEAIAALKPVVATRFPHAVELLTDGAGLLVPHKDPAAIAEALRTLLTRHELGVGMSQAAAASAPDLMWPAVADRYRDLAARLISARLAA
jgi:glycosyltransferase involved in cell wall biosynthesis